MKNATNPTDEGTLRARQGTEHVKVLEVGDRVLADYLPQMIWIMRDSDRQLMFTNVQFRDYLGSIEADWDKRSEIFHVDDQVKIADAFEAVRRLGHAPRAEVRIRGKDDCFRWHKVMLAPVFADGTLVEWIVTALDIHEMVSARLKLQDLTDLFSLSLEAAGAGNWDLDLRNGGVSLSRESARLHGIATDDAVEMDLARWSQIVDPDDAKIVLRVLQEAVDTRCTFNGEFRIRLPDGTVRWLSGVGRAYYDAKGDAVRMIGLNFDVTERKTTEAKLLAAHADAEEARRNAERASTAKTDFLAGMSHEIRTPLNSIIGYTDLLMEEVAHGAPFRRKLEVIQESGAALLTVVNDILDFSKIEAGQVELLPIVFSPKALVANVVSMLFGEANKKGLAIDRAIASNVPDFVLGDESRVRQILLNLVANAVKFTEIGRIAIAIEKEGSRAGGAAERIRFCVKDTGIGIPVQQQQRLFQRFSQVDGSITKRFGGTGLGLAICKQLVELMQGDIGVESREGEGATFWFSLPLPLARLCDVRDKNAPDDQGPTRGARILLVEDVPVNQDLAKSVLERAGHTVDIASNGVEAIEAVRAKIYDLVLMDVQMPVMDGIAATQAIRASDHPSRRVPIIAMTANVLPQQVASLKNSGMDDHVGKPFKRPELLAAIQKWTHCEPAPETASVCHPAASRVQQDRHGV